MNSKRKLNETSDLNKKNKSHAKNSIQINLLLNNYYKENINKISELYKNNKPIEICLDKDANLRIITQPFKCCILDNFIKNKSFLTNLKTELITKVKYFNKNNDLYKFKQSKDLKFLDFPYCKSITKLFKNDLLSLIKNITNLNLFDYQIDITASKYEFTDVLLCHDDMLEERKIAFIYYLVEDDWSENDGGKLEFFSRDNNDQPLEVTLCLIPKFNNFIFFEVSPYSYHQVTEILSKTKVRLSINGWFSALTNHIKKPFLENFILPIKYNNNLVEKEIFQNYFNALYLTDDIQKGIKLDFENESQTILVNFLDENKFKLIKDELKNCKKLWKLKFLANRRKYFYLDKKDYPKNLEQLVSIVTSEAFFLILGNLTGLKLHPLNKDNSSDSDSESEKYTEISDPRCSIEIRKWEKGCYTLIHDEDGEVIDKNPKLDVKLYFDHEFDANLNNGGCTYYLEKNEDNELLIIEPINNSLALVYRDEETVKFEKYLNCQHESTFYELSMIFQE